MTLLETWVRTPAAQALGWTLFHSLWQGAIVALALAAALTVLRSSRLRYASACLGMVAMLAGFGLTFVRCMAQQQVTVTTVANFGSVSHAADGFQFPPVLREPEATIAHVLPWLAPFWIAGVVIFHLCSLASWLAARRLRRRGVCCAPELWQLRLDRLSARLRLSRPVTLLESCLAEVPVVIGHLRPVILMPLGLLANLPADQIEAILLHELSHILRYDYLVNLLQTAVEGLLFYHPTVWWISRMIRGERENCCDDLVVAISGDPHAYAVALATLEQVRSTAPEAAPAATGGNLVKRIRRLLNQPEGPRVSIMPILSAGVLTITAALALTAWQSKPADRPPMPAPPTAPAVKPPVKLLAQAQPSPERPPIASAYRKWLDEDVVYIASDEERRAFLALRTDEEREHFIEQFWLRRDPTPGTVENEYKQEHYRRIAYANQHFGTASTPGWKTDRGRIYIVYGPPDELESHPRGGPAPQFPPYPFAQWLYHHIAGVGDNIVITFVDSTRSGEYRMTTDPRSAVGTTKTGATVQIGTGTASLSIPISSPAEYRVTVYGLIVGPNRGLFNVFQESVQGPMSVYTKTLSLPPGSYQLNVAVKDPPTGTISNDWVDFEVK